MCEMIIEKGIIVDDVERMLEELRERTNMKIKDPSIVKKFVCSEINTKFYVDEKLKATVNADTKSVYLWLDTGFCDEYDKPLFISLLRCCGEYIGHIIGTAKELMESVKGFFPAYSKHIKNNFPKFLQKYDVKSRERSIVHISDEQVYFLSKVNVGTEVDGILSKKLKELNVDWEADGELEVDEQEEIFCEAETPSDIEEEITMHFLIKKLDELENLNKELMQIVETKTVKEDDEIGRLKEKVREYEEAFVRIRLFNEKEQLDKSADFNESNYGHGLLGKNKQILVLGDTKIGVDKMQGIAKDDYGFEKGDFEFITDYDKVVHAAKRVQNSGKYAAIIFGCCPHKVKNTNWSSIIEQFKNCVSGIVSVDARTQSGQLKVTKESYRNALDIICDQLYSSPAVA